MREGWHGGEGGRRGGRRRKVGVGRAGWMVIQKREPTKQRLVGIITFISKLIIIRMTNTRKHSFGISGKVAKLENVRKVVSVDAQAVILKELRAMEGATS